MVITLEHVEEYVSKGFKEELLKQKGHPNFYTDVITIAFGTVYNLKRNKDFLSNVKETHPKIIQHLDKISTCFQQDQRIFQLLLKLAMDKEKKYVGEVKSEKEMAKTVFESVTKIISEFAELQKEFDKIDFDDVLIPKIKNFNESMKTYISNREEMYG